MMASPTKRILKKYKRRSASESVKKAASILGKIGGPIGGPARAKALSSSERTSIASKAAKTRWGAHKRKKG
jgi:hypothetical protein